MRIRLKNFRCYTDSTFDFGEGGLALISGPSGKGKSSILMGIYFALFGTGSKVTSYGKTSCTVELEFDGMKIVRTKRPNRVVVNDVYEDASAQEIINRKFGDTFDVTGYIAQNAIGSFIIMSPIEKIAFLEKFAFRDVDLGKIKGRCKAHISKCNEELISAVSQLNMARNVLEEMKIPNEVKFPLKCAKTQREKAIKNENIRFKNCNTIIRRSEKIIDEISTEISDLRVLEATLESRNESLKELDEKLKNLESDINKNTYDGHEKLSEYENRLESLLAKRELNIIEDKLENDLIKLEKMRKEEKVELEKEKNNICEILWKEYSKSDILITISELKECLSDLDKIKLLSKEMKRYNVDPEKHQENKKELEKYIQEIEDKKRLREKFLTQQELYSCPSCATKLRLINESLHLVNDVNEEDIDVDIDLDRLEDNIQTLKHNISKLQRIIPDEENKLGRIKEIENDINNILYSYDEVPDANDIREDLEYLHEYQAKHNELENKLNKIEKNIIQEKFSSSYSTFKSDVEKLKKSVEELKEKTNNVNEEMKEEELREYIIEQRYSRNKLEEIENCKRDTIENREKIENIIKQTISRYNDIYGEIKKEEDLQGKKLIEENKIIEHENKRISHEKTLEQIEAWKKYQEDLENYQVWETKVEELEKSEKYARNEYAAATMLKDKILEAESISIVNIIDSINTHARVYLDLFFQDNPISVQLQPFKETKKGTKPQINISIEYKGMEADLRMLSGGEISRVILAYTLALAEMFNTPLLLLDECTASLDQDLTNDVFDAIRENFSGKMTLFIAHQVVTGTFDKVINLENDSEIFVNK